MNCLLVTKGLGKSHSGGTGRCQTSAPGKRTWYWGGPPTLSRTRTPQRGSTFTENSEDGEEDDDTGTLVLPSCRVPAQAAHSDQGFAGLPHLLLTTALGGRAHSDPSFADEETEAGGCEVTSSRLVELERDARPKLCCPHQAGLCHRAGSHGRREPFYHVVAKNPCTGRLPEPTAECP